jgi:hypothetical protein
VRRAYRCSDRLFFTLSSFHAPSISEFKTPSISLRDSDTQLDLMPNWTIASAGASQAVIMCCAEKQGDATWSVIAVAKFSKGTARDYTSMLNTCSQFVRDYTSVT